MQYIWERIYFQETAYAINGSKSVGKPRGAGIIFILVFTITCMLFVNLTSEIIIYLILVLAAMLSGYLDDASSSPWGELKKGIIDFIIAVMAGCDIPPLQP